MSSGIAGNARCAVFFWAIRNCFLKTGHPQNLTWINIAAQGGRGKVPGTVEEIEQHDGSVVRLHKVAADYDPQDRVAAMNYLHTHAARGEVVTGLLYLDPNPDDLHSHLNTVKTPLNALGDRELCPGAKALDAINASLR